MPGGANTGIQNNTLYNTGLQIGSAGRGPYDLDNNAVWRNGGTCYSTQQVGRNNNNYCRTSGAAASDVFVDPAGVVSHANPPYVHHEISPVLT